MNAKSNLYALAALKKRRGEIAGTIVELERKLRHQKESLVHVDATLRLLDPSIEVGAIPNKRLTKRVKLFRQGELAQLVRDALREAGGKPVKIDKIVTYLLKAGGHSEKARDAVAPRVRGNLAYLQRKGVVVKTGEQREARWRLA